ncbi:UPF0481 protein [Acorus calamus]|uniref:UPF0481 protein n=1 Tax=Acorus calamus TaxID=4465 RepID=A0AAV9EW97_ACOCL|nr:UPF0481 protein [Acorus calamus]
MEKHKWRMVRRLLSRRREVDLLGECLRKVKALKERAKSCYAEVIDMGDSEFVEMMVLDGCFLIGVLHLERSETNKRKNENMETVMEEEEEEEEDDWVWKAQKDQEEVESDAMHSSLWLLEHVNHDLLKVENQIPFFVVEALFNLLVLQPDHGPNATIYDLAMNLLNKLNPSNAYVWTTKDTKVHHLFHLFYEMVVPEANSDDTETSSSSVQESTNLIDPAGFLKIKKTTQGILLRLRNSIPISFARNDDLDRKEMEWSSSWIKSATEMEEAGVKFVVKRDSSFLDVSFKGGVMEFPILHIYEHTMVLFRNLIAFEQCYLDTEDHITFYAMFMDNLIDTPMDVKVLQRGGMLRIGISSEKEVAQFFNNLCREVYFENSKSYLADLTVDVNRYCDSKTHRWRAVLARDYFNNPWAVISVVAAFILLGLTILQTFYTMYGYYNP